MSVTIAQKILVKRDEQSRPASTSVERHGLTEDQKRALKAAGISLAMSGDQVVEIP